jgi:hypothetical protein
MTASDEHHGAGRDPVIETTPREHHGAPRGGPGPVLRGDEAHLRGRPGAGPLGHHRHGDRARFDLEHAELELATALERVKAAELAWQPVAADLAQVDAELAATELAGSLDERLAARARRYALEQEREPLAELEQRQRTILDRARQDAGSFELALPGYRAALDEATRCLASPPLYDISRLFEVAPLAANVLVLKAGPEMLMGDIGFVLARSPHAISILVALQRHLRTCGAWKL